MRQWLLDAARCGAKTRRGTSCQGPAMPRPQRLEARALFGREREVATVCASVGKTGHLDVDGMRARYELFRPNFAARDRPIIASFLPFLGFSISKIRGF